ncbi:ABC transporter ATP-binding protein [Aquamicrobium lusatiense]|uniref:ABC transporter ATP-binding protein n=2 Tax=Aquamicrobium TaxID=69278 RepID=UPI002455D9C4|nr:ABC transporter ATP-binding protein [Aquamicrobium lusatiense]MDH4991377.1 ABC transporter ATP-binding protein [Aquamicrobium lusatiense]
MTLLSVENLSVRLGHRQVLNGLGFEVEAGEFVGLIGPNGAGKSTLLRSVLDLVPTQGHIRLSGEVARAMNARRRATRVAYLAQEREIAWAVPVETIVALGREPHRTGFAAPTAQDRAIINDAIQRMDIEAFRDRIATELSGGEKARVLTARALAQDAPLLLADEPTAGLDPAHQISLMRLFASLAAGGKSVVASLHDLGLAARWCSRLLLLHEGRIVADGSPKQVLTPQNLRDIYGVEAFFGEAGAAPVIQPLDLAGLLS